MDKLVNIFSFFFLFLIFINCDQLLARGEHRIQVQNYGHRDPEIPIWIMESNYYNAHHDAYMIRIEDLNETLNKEINEVSSLQYSMCKLLMHIATDRKRKASPFHHSQQPDGPKNHLAASKGLG